MSSKKTKITKSFLASKFLQRKKQRTFQSVISPRSRLKRKIQMLTQHYLELDSKKNRMNNFQYYGTKPHKIRQTANRISKKELENRSLKMELKMIQNILHNLQQSKSSIVRSGTSNQETEGMEMVGEVNKKKKKNSNNPQEENKRSIQRKITKPKEENRKQNKNKNEKEKEKEKEKENENEKDKETNLGIQNKKLQGKGNILIEKKLKKILKIQTKIEQIKNQGQKKKLQDLINEEQIKLKNKTNKTNDLISEHHHLKETLKLEQENTNQYLFKLNISEEGKEKLMIQEKTLEKYRNDLSTTERRIKKLHFELGNMKSSTAAFFMERDKHQTLRIKINGFQKGNSQLRLQIFRIVEYLENSEMYSELLSENYSDYLDSEFSSYGSESSGWIDQDDISLLSRNNTDKANDNPQNSQNSQNSQNFPKSNNNSKSMHKKNRSFGKGKLSLSISIDSMCLGNNSTGSYNYNKNNNSTDNIERIRPLSARHNTRIKNHPYQRRYKHHRNNSLSKDNTQGNNDPKKTEHSLDRKASHGELRVFSQLPSKSYYEINRIKKKNPNNIKKQPYINTLSNDDLLINKSNNYSQRLYHQKRKRNTFYTPRLKKNMNNNNRNSSKNEKEGKKNIQIESLEVLLSIPVAVDYFKEFLCQQLNQENIMFFQEVKQFKRNCRSEKQIRKKSKEIFIKFIKPGSLFEINIISSCRKTIMKHISQRHYFIDMFDEAQEAVFDHLTLNSWESFLNSVIYENLLKKLRNDTTIDLNPDKKRCLLIYHKKKTKALNEEFSYRGKKNNAYQIGEELMLILMNLLNCYYSVNSKSINMKVIAKSIPFRKFVELSSGLQNITLKNLTTEQRLCFFINLYNTLTLHSFVINGVPKDKPSVEKFLRNSIYRINDYYFSLNDIYHGILRGNTDPKQTNNNYFKNYDLGYQEKCDLAITPMDPRIHFALINYTFPSFIRIYHLESFNDTLAKVTQHLLSNLVFVKENKILIPKLFAIYEKDFGGTENIINWISKNAISKFDIDKHRYYSVRFTQKIINSPSISFDVKRTIARKFSNTKLFDEN
ncbi:electron carrier/ protein disulfide oxidoreductase [Anaeramoeba flamelloides]|uniref:Electron carrier/ protein disulfide oxidoreductase n=1 Tax=Anaeramoeba flamelloides TaxID=1746091 RepID=A0AAV7YI82_9EUKA|nr:electron carrier/ protein disulfide oxidoreductase [Anaeramoeba flamelloides]